MMNEDERKSGPASSHRTRREEDVANRFGAGLDAGWLRWWWPRLHFLRTPDSQASYD